MESSLLMKHGSFRLKAAELFKKHKGEKTLYRVAQDGGGKYPTLHRIIETPEKMKDVRSGTVFELLSGLGFSVEEIKQLTIGEIFEYIPDNE